MILSPLRSCFVRSFSSFPSISFHSFLFLCFFVFVLVSLVRFARSFNIRQFLLPFSLVNSWLRTLTIIPLVSENWATCRKGGSTQPPDVCIFASYFSLIRSLVARLLEPRYRESHGFSYLFFLFFIYVSVSWEKPFKIERRTRACSLKLRDKKYCARLKNNLLCKLLLKTV